MRGFQFLSAKPLLIAINLDESSLPRRVRYRSDRAPRRRPDAFLSRSGTAAAAVCAKIDLEIAQLEAATRAFLAASV